MATREKTAAKIKIDPRWKAKWVVALRSRKYTQGFRDYGSPGYPRCALGVLLSLVTPNTEVTPNTDAVDVLSLLSDVLNLSREKMERVAQWIIYMNDAERRSFRQISNYVEKNL